MSGSGPPAARPRLLPSGLPAVAAGPWVAWIAIAAGFVIMAAWSWQTWPDVLVDYGRELYVPWRLAAGQTLYTEIAYFNGPLSPYFNSVWFRLFEPSVLTLSLVNLAVTAVIVGLLYRIVTALADRLTATVAALLFVTVFGFGQLLDTANYNYVSPYSHEMTHGIVLSLLTIDLLIVYLRTRRPVLLGAAGAALGLVFLTKPELFAAAAVAQAAGLACMVRAARGVRGVAARRLGGFLAAAAAPPLVAFALLWTAMPAEAALGATLGGWPSVFNSELTSLPFYRRGMGLDEPGRNFLLMLLWSGGYAAAVAPAIFVAFIRRGGARVRLALSGAVFVAVFVPLLLVDAGWADAFRPLPLLMLLAAAAAIAGFWRSSPSEPSAAKPIGRVVMIVFAGALLAKMSLNARIEHYGFALAMPATMVLVMVGLCWGPQWLARRQRSAAPLGAATAAVLCAAAVGHLRIYHEIFRHKTLEVGTGRDVIRAFDTKRGRSISELLGALDGLMRPDETLAVLPEGVMVNFLGRRLNPTPYLNFMPAELIIFGEAEMIAAFAAHPPDVIVTIPRNTAEYGFGAFGQGYGERLHAWTLEHYRPVTQIGDILVSRVITNDLQGDQHGRIAR